MLEVITPAPNAESVIAAVQSGADAIIIRFGGAAGSGFTQAEFTKSVRYCRVRGCRVYAELDTLVADSELPAAAELARSACEAGVDAVIAQDWGFIPAARQAAPELRVFAGERLGLHNAAGIEAALQLGASRVLLPCELSAEEIAALARRGRAELGVTAYGTLCASRQGQCYMAAINGRGSANRGSCPGLCREKYSLGGRMDDYPLSLRDLMALDRIPEFSALGIASVVVGRGLTRPEQLAKLTSVAAKCAKDGRKPTPLETDELELVLTGRQFTPGYYPGGPSEDMQGLPGQPDRDAERAMHALRKGYADSELRRVKVEFFALIQAGRPFRSGIQDEDGNRAVWNGPEPMEAFGREFTQGTVEAEFRRTSGTPYSCERVNVMLGPGLMLPEGTLQQARRELIRALTVKRAEPPQVETGRLIPVPGGSPEVASLDTIFEVMSAAQLTEELAELEPDFLYVPLDVLAEDPGSIESFLRRGATVAAVMPRVIHDGELRGVAALLQKARTAGVTQALVGNLGHVGIARAAGLDLRGDWSLNLFNSYSLQIAAKAGLLSAAVSFELNMEQIRQLSKPLDTEIIAYGRLPAMLTERCLIKASAGRCACGAPARMSDEYGGVYPVLREYVCRNAVYGPAKVFLGDRLDDVKKAGVRGARLLFTNEGPRECVEVAKSFLGLSGYRPNGLTRGLYYRGVE